MKQSQLYALCFFVLVMVFGAVQPFVVVIEAHAEQCFYENVDEGRMLGLTFEVVEGGSLDIDLEVTGPNGESMYQGTKESSGKYTFAAYKTGFYTFCFSNKMSTMTQKAVMFSTDVSDSRKGDDQESESEHHDKLETMITELSAALTGVKQEQEYMEVRERIHRDINDSTNSLVVLWAFFESAVLVAMTLGQVYYLKRFFEVRRVV